MNENVERALRSIGLTKAEVEVYIDLLQHDPSTALDISKRTGHYRQSIYDSLWRLEEKGFIVINVLENKKLFNAREPEKINDYLKQRQQEVESLIPQLRDITNTIPQKEVIILSHGLLSARNCFTKLLQQNKPAYIFCKSQMLIEQVGEGFLAEFHKERIKKKIPLHILFQTPNVERVHKLNTMPHTEARYLEQHRDSLVTNIITEDKVFIIILEKPVSVIEMNSKNIAQSYLDQFLFDWKHGKTNSRPQIPHSQKQP